MRDVAGPAHGLDSEDRYEFYKPVARFVVGASNHAASSDGKTDLRARETAKPSVDACAHRSGLSENPGSWLCLVLPEPA